MPTRDLTRDLERLRAELAKLAPGDSTVRARIEALIAEIEQKIAAPEDPHRHKSVVDAVTGAIEHFETSHPRATAILNDIMVTLGNMGI